MPEIETKVTVDAGGAAEAMGRVAGATGKFTSEIRTARGALHEFHGISRMIEGVLSGNLTGAIHGSIGAMRSLTHMAMHPLILVMAAAAAGVYALTRAWSNHVKEQEKVIENYRKIADAMEKRKEAAAPGRYTEVGIARRAAHLAARRGDIGALQEMAAGQVSKIDSENAAIDSIDSLDSPYRARLVSSARNVMRRQRQVAEAEQSKVAESFIPKIGGGIQMAHRFVAGWYLRNAKEDFESVRASREGDLAQGFEKRGRDVEILKGIHDELKKFNKSGVSQ